MSATTQTDRPLRVLVVTNLWPQDGSFRGIFVKEQVEAIRQLGHHVDVEVVAQSRGRLDYLLAAFRVRQRVRDGSYDVVHVHYGLTALAARLAGRVPRVLTMHGSDVDVGWQRVVTRLGAAGVAQRIYCASRLAHKMGDPGGHVIPVGVDTSLFSPMDQGQARRQLSIPADEPVVLFGAHPSNPVKGYDVFRDVLSALRERGVPARELILAEPGQPRAAVPVKFAAADVLLCTSRKGTESGPAVVKEAVAMGLPVVSVDVGDVASVLAGVSPSYVVSFPEPWGDAQSRRRLVESLTERVADVLAKRQRSNGPTRARDFDNRSIAARVVDVYRRAAASRTT